MASSAECSVVCNRLVFEAVNENSIFKLQFVKRTYSEIQLLTGLAQCNEEGETPLVIAMKGKDISFIDDLVTLLKSCDHTISENGLKLFIVISKLSSKIPILDLIDYLIGDINNYTHVSESTKWLKFMAQVFIKSSSFTRQDKVTALELIGARLINTVKLNEVDSQMPMFGLDCWKEAITLRHSLQDGELLPKPPAVFVPSSASSVVFGSSVDLMMMEEPQLLLEDFEHNYLSLDLDMRLECVKQMKLQSILVLRRISTQANLQYIYRLYLESLYDFADFLEMDGSNLLINTYLLILEQMNGFDLKQLSRPSITIFMSIILNVSLYFRMRLREPHDSPGRRELSYVNLIVASKPLSIVLKIFLNNAAFGDFAEHVYCFLYVLESISHQLTNQEQQTLEKYYRDYIRDSPERTTTVLHVAIDSQWSDGVLHLGTIRLILKLGADPNAIDEFGRTPLHILVADIFKGKYDLERHLAVFKALVDAGTHLDMATDDGDTVLCVLKETVMRYKSWQRNIHPYFESLTNTDFPLSCYAARVIRRNRIPFDGDRLPPPLQKFVRTYDVQASTF